MTLSLRGKYMIDNLTITRVWQDDDFFQIEVNCNNQFASAKSRIYTDDCLIDDLYNKVGMFLSGQEDSVFWQNGTKGNATTPCISLRFLHKDKVGHIFIEVFVEIEDGGDFDTHNCCFYINTEMGLLYQFRDKLLNVKKKQLGVQVSLNGDNSTIESFL